jgi:hypothetical protein
MKQEIKNRIMKRLRLVWKQFLCPHMHLQPVYHSYECLDCEKMFYD